METITLNDPNVKTYMKTNKITIEKYIDNRELAAKYNVEAFPTVIYLENGHYKDRRVGYIEPYYFIEFLKRNK